MIKVIDKAFKIIEYIASRNDTSVAPGELAAALKLNHPTCIRILKNMVELGYLVQISRQKGYVLGPMSFAIAGGKRYMQTQIDIAEPIIKACAEETKQFLLLAVRHKERRYILCSHNGNSSLNINVNKLWYDDLYEFASGRLLLAYASEDDLAWILKKKGLPSFDEWQDAIAEKDMNNILNEIRKVGFATNESPFHVGIACPIFVNEVFTFALSITVDKSDISKKSLEFYLNKIKMTAKSISNQCSNINTVG